MIGPALARVVANRRRCAVLLIVILLLAACSTSGGPDPAPEPTQTPPVGRLVTIPTSPPASAPTVEAVPETLPVAAPTPAVEPDIPIIVDELSFGVAAGNGLRPYQVAVDSQRRRVYTLNYGISALDEGNTISVLDLETGGIVALIHLDNVQEGELRPPDPLDLQVDPYRPRLYALWGDRYGETTGNGLTIIDADRLDIVATLPGVEAVAPGPDRLYMVNDTRLWAVDPDSGVELEARDLEPRELSEPLLLFPQANRLYLGRGYPWSLEVFAADSLNPVESYSVPDRLIRAVVDADRSQLLILESDGELVVLRALDADGRPLAEPGPVPVTDQVYSDVPLAFDGQTLYLVAGDYTSYQVQAYALPELAPLDSLPLRGSPSELAIDAGTGLLYAVYNSPSSYILMIDPASGREEPVYTALAVTDALADADAGRLYVLDDGGALSVLDLADYSPIARLETGFSRLTGAYYGSYGRISLDSDRKRLYVDGDPAWIVDTASLQVMATLDGRGQVTPDPAGDRVYLTSPCACRLEQCNTLILSADTLTGTETLFPPEDPFTAPCVVSTRLDPANQLLYAQIYNGTPGSNSGDYFSVFDVSGPPREIYTAFDISYGDVAFDAPNKRVFAPRYRINRSFIQRFDVQDDGTITRTLELVGAHGQLAYDPGYDRLYAVQYDGPLQVFDGDLTLLAEITVPDESALLTFDREGQRLYLRGPDKGKVMVVATGGGRLEPPPPVIPTTDVPQTQQLLTAPDGTLLRVHDYRLYRSDDGGGSWDLLGQGLPGRPVGAVAISPDYDRDQLLLVGLWGDGHGGGLYRSDDRGETWRPTTRGLADMEISDILFSPTFARDQTIFLTTFDRGLYRSTDGGQTWISLAHSYATDSFDLEVDQLALSPAFADDGLIIIGRRNLLRSTDGGDSWQDSGVPAGLVAFSPNFAADGLILSEGRWRSADRGQTWEPAATGLAPAGLGAQRLFFSADFATDQTLYILLAPEHGAALTLQRSIDAGRSWFSLAGGLPAGFEITSATILPAGELFLTAQDGRQLAVPGEALVWGRAPVDVAGLDLQDLAIAADGSIFVANSAAGVFKSVDGGRTWAETGFPARADAILRPARLAAAGDGTLLAAVGTVVARSTDGGGSWTRLRGVPHAFQVASLALSPNFSTDGIAVIGGDYTTHQILRSQDAGDTWQVVFDGTAVHDASGVTIITFSPNFATDGTLYAWLEYGGLLQSTDGGLTWSLATSDQSDYYAQSLAVSAAGDRVYLGALGGHLLVSDDGGQHWVDLGDGIAGERVWSSALALKGDDVLLLGTEIGVYRSRDGGETWSGASAGLAVHPGEERPQEVRVLRFDGERLYAALTSGGLFVSENLGQTWRSTITGRPASAIQATPTPTPEAQPPTGPAPLPPVSQSFSVAADCPLPPDHFVNLWAGRVAQLGCPVESYQVPMVEQAFEGGWMFWRSDTATIYALPSNQPYGRFEDTWDDSQPPYSCPDLFPLQTPPTPHRGFGKVWCNEPLIRKLLGNATTEERLFDAVLQEFDTGLIFKTGQGVIYILESGLNGWEQVEANQVR